MVKAQCVVQSACGIFPIKIVSDMGVPITLSIGDTHFEFASLADYRTFLKMCIRFDELNGDSED